MRHDPLAPRSRRITPYLIWGTLLVVVVSVFGIMGYLYLEKRAQLNAALQAANESETHTSNGVFKFREVGPYVPEPVRSWVNGADARDVPQKVSPPTPTQTAQKPVKPKPKPVLDMKQNRHEAPPQSPSGPLYTLPAWTYVPCEVENVINSEIEGFVTVQTIRPTYDPTGQHLLIPQHHRIGAKTHTAELLPGNERIPTTTVSTTLAGHDIQLTDAVIMDQAGTLGLTGKVNRHTWRAIWSSVFIGGFQGGQQVLQMQLGSDGYAPIAAGIARQGAATAQQRLGRAQDMRPTIEVAAGQLCQALFPKSFDLPASTRH